MKKIIINAGMLSSALLLAVVFNCSQKDDFSPNAAGDESGMDAGDLAKAGDFPGGEGPEAGLCGDGGMGKILNLTEEQRSQIREIRRELIKENRPPCKGKKPGHGPRGPRPRLSKGMRDSLFNAMLPILTEEQRQKALAIKAQLDSGVVPDELIDLRLACFTEKLGLSDSQQVQLRPILVETGTQMLALRDSSLNPPEHQQAMRAIHESFESQVLALLTPEQQAAYKALLTEHKPKMKGPKPGMGKHRRHGQR